MDVYVHCSSTILGLVIGFVLVDMAGGLAASAGNGSRQEVMSTASMIRYLSFCWAIISVHGSSSIGISV